MANTDNPRGFSPIRGNSDGPPKRSKYPCNTTTDVFQGDVVQLLANGRVKSITTTTGNAAIVGVAANYVDASDSSDAQDIYVYDDPDQRFMGQDDGDSATPSAAVVGATFALILTTGNTVTGLSKQEIDASAAGVATTDPVIVEGFVQGPKQEIGKYATHIFKLNRHIFNPKSAGI